MGRRLCCSSPGARRGALAAAPRLRSSAAAGAARQNAKKARTAAAVARSCRSRIGPAPAPARFFTINQVLAKRRRRSAPARRLAVRQHRRQQTATRRARRAGDRRCRATSRSGSPPSARPKACCGSNGAASSSNCGGSQEIGLAAASTDGMPCSPAARRFADPRGNAKAREGRARIDLVNRAVNAAIRYASDYAQHGVADLWTAPLATLAAGRGDCEDYAIAKYVVLRAAGVPAPICGCCWCATARSRQDHAVLAVRDNGRWLVLDNRAAPCSRRRRCRVHRRCSRSTTRASACLPLPTRRGRRTRARSTSRPPRPTKASAAARTPCRC